MLNIWVEKVYSVQFTVYNVKISSAPQFVEGAPVFLNLGVATVARLLLDLTPPEENNEWLSGTSKWSGICLSGTPKWSAIWLPGTPKRSKISVLKKLKLFFGGKVKKMFFKYFPKMTNTKWNYCQINKHHNTATFLVQGLPHSGCII